MELGEHCVEVTEKCAFLMGILAVAHLLCVVKRYAEFIGVFDRRFNFSRCEVVEDIGVIAGRDCECLSGEPAAFSKR